MTTPEDGGASFRKPGRTRGGVRFDKPAPATPTPQYGTPEAPLEQDVGPTYDLASWGRRAAAWIIDAVVVLAITVGLGVLAWLIVVVPSDQPRRIYEVGDDAEGEFLVLLVWFVAFSFVLLVVSLLYAPLWMWRTNGRTLGKQILGIRVVRADGSRMTYGFAVFREFLVKGLLGAIASSFTLYLYGVVDALWPLWDSERRAIHDYIASTRVVRD